MCPARFPRLGHPDKKAVRRSHETLANLSGLGEQTVASIEAALTGTPLVPARDAVTITRSLPHGHLAAAHAMAAKLGLPPCWGRPAGRWRWR